MAGEAPRLLLEFGTLVGARRVDAVVSDTLLPAAGIEAWLRGVPWVTFGDGPLLWWDEGTPPFGTGLPPMAGERGRGRNRRVQAVIDRLLFAPAVEALNAVRRNHGMGSVETLREATMSQSLHVQGCSPGFEYPRDPWPEHVRFVGALGPGRGFGPPPPEVLRRGSRSRPLALVTQGTLRPDPTELVVPACRALVGEGFQVLVAGMEPGAWNRGGDRVTVMPRVGYPEALDEADLFVTNGGYTGVTLAVAAGVPVLQAGGSEEKPDIGARLVWSGVGSSIRVTRPPWWLIRREVRRLTQSAERREASRRLATESHDYDARTLAPRLIDELLVAWRR